MVQDIDMCLYQRLVCAVLVLFSWRLFPGLCFCLQEKDSDCSPTCWWIVKVDGKKYRIGSNNRYSNWIIECHWRHLHSFVCVGFSKRTPALKWPQTLICQICVRSILIGTIPIPSSMFRVSCLSVKHCRIWPVTLVGIHSPYMHIYI